MFLFVAGHGKLLQSDDSVCEKHPTQIQQFVRNRSKSLHQSKTGKILRNIGETFVDAEIVHHRYEQRIFSTDRVRKYLKAKKKRRAKKQKTRTRINV